MDFDPRGLMTHATATIAADSRAKVARRVVQSSRSMRDVFRRDLELPRGHMNASASRSRPFSRRTARIRSS